MHDQLSLFMAKFLRIGVHDSNVSGYTSKAWSIHRVRSTVQLKWGAVDVRGTGAARQISWKGRPQQKTLRCGTEKRARNYVKHAISRRLEHRYERLPENTRIFPRLVGPKTEPARAQATVLFVDIVASTQKAALLGDHRWSQVMDHYYAAVRRALRAARGREVTTTGDGMLATFKQPDGAIQCAVTIRDAVRTLGLEIRAGLHAGEYKLIGDELVGIAIHIGARIAAKARASEVLVSSAVRDLVPDAGINFSDRGLHRLKGVPRGWRLYGVDSKTRSTARIRASPE